MEKFFQNTKYSILNTLLFLFPLFFLTTTPEFFITNKLYLLTFGVLILSLITAFELLLSKKIVWSTKVLDIPVILFIGAISLSVIFSSTNKIQALLNLSFGLAMFITLGLLYFYLSRSKHLSSIIFYLSSIILSIVAIIFFFQPFKIINLPSSWQFLKNPGFTPLGSQIDLAVFLGFFLIFSLFNLKKILNTPNLLAKIYYQGSVILALTGLILTIYSLMSNPPLLPPLSLSWHSVLEIMKNVRTAFFGIGIDNFSQLFTSVKNLGYNQSPLWTISSFSVARNVIFHLIAETGIIGVVSFAFMIFTAIKASLVLKKSLFISLLAGLVAVFSLVPPSLPLFFLLFIVFGMIGSEEKHPHKVIEFNEFPFLLYGLFIVITTTVAISGYFLGRSYLAEYYFKLTANSLAINNVKGVYDNIRMARILNPYQENYVLNFSQTNLIIADSIARKGPEKITESDRQTIAQAVQAAISEAKELVRLNPNKASSFENLANIYRNIIPIANGADAWAVSSYQRAIILDPSNPSYRLNLGGIYYLIGRYTDAVKLFEQAVSLKPDWPNASYNLAWAYFQNQEYDKAALTMQNVVNLVDKKVSPQDWDKANKDLNDFKNKLLSSQEQATESGELNLPKKSEKELNPKIKLPPEASPEVK